MVPEATAGLGLTTEEPLEHSIAPAWRHAERTLAPRGTADGSVDEGGQVEGAARGTEDSMARTGAGRLHR